MHSLPSHRSKSMGFANDAACQEAGATSLMWLNRVINTIPQAVYWKDQNNQFLGCNQAFAHAAGLTDPDAILGKSAVELPDDMQSQLLSDRDRVVLQTNQPEHHTLDLTDTRKCPTWVNIQKLPLQDDYGSAIGVVCTIEDITCAKQAELQLQQSEAGILVAPAITETQESDHQLRDSKTFLSHVLNGVDDPIFVKDRDHRWVLMNDSFCRFLGRDRAELLNKTDYDFFPKAEADLFWQKDEWLFISGNTDENENSFTGNDGKTVTISTKKSPFTDQNNHQFLVGTIRDITDRKQTEFALEDLNEAWEARVEVRTAALRESEARLRTLMANLPVGVWATDATARYIVQNPTSFEQWGDLIGKQPQDLDLPSEVIDTWLEEQRRILAGEIIRKEDCHRHDGHVWFYSTILAPIWDGDLIIGLLGVSTDITEQKRTEAALRENEDTLRGILQNMPVMMDAFDENGTIITWNSECERVTGYSANEVIGNPNVIELLYPDPVYRDEMMQIWAQLGDNYRNWEWKIWCKDGTVKTVLWSNLSGQFPVPGWASWGIAIDISDRKQAELQLQASENCLRQQAQELTDTLKELQRTQSQLVQSEKMSSLGQLVAGVAHEINNPVNFIY
ncbi:PAS domain S-box protein, partial (plasmid) [Phormidium sp. CLA17]|uniref:PAS domain-containing sensor histidine kinase n=1 Tax=Leptolyngbya sp. Cla-17 TaxID=2803751 RepID=UPI001490C633